MNKQSRLASDSRTLRSTLSTLRAGQAGPKDEGPSRTPFEADIDRLIFDSHFRALGDKTQVHRVNSQNTTRSRLSHSIEVSRVGRSLGRAFVTGTAELSDDPELLNDTQDVLMSAGLLHDMGTPPFGHPGEDEISNFFKHTEIGAGIMTLIPEEQRSEFTCFDSNAQTLRYAMQIGGWSEVGGLRLTAATIAAATKYPFDATHKGPKRAIFVSNLENYEVVADACSLRKTAATSWQRHPLSYLSEAADDITYEIVDLEDAALLGIIEIDLAIEMLMPLVSEKASSRDADYKDMPANRRIPYLRSQAISNLVNQAGAASRNYRNQIMQDRLPARLSRLLPCSDELNNVAKFSRLNIYNVANAASSDVRAVSIRHLLTTAAAKHRKPASTQEARTLAHALCDAITASTDSACVNSYHNHLRHKDLQP